MTEKNSSFVDGNDKLTGVKQLEIEEWNGTCVYCSSLSLLIHPLGVTYRSHTISNFDDLPTSITNYFRKLPNVVQAVLECIDGRNQNLLVECMNCKQTVRGFKNHRPETMDNEKIFVNKSKLRRYLNDLYGVSDSEELMHRIKSAT